MDWIDSHAHLDAYPLADCLALSRLAAAQQLRHILIPATSPGNWATVRALAHQLAYSYALGIHPYFSADLDAESALTALAQTLEQQQADTRLVAVGETGLDFDLPALQTPALQAQQISLYRQQLALAQAHQLPVILHVRRSADALLQGLRASGFAYGGIVHAFNGSMQQAQQFLDRGFKLGFGGALTYPRAQRLHQLARHLPLSAFVLETDSPDMPPSWLYTPRAEREAGTAQALNTPLELPRIAAYLAALRGLSSAELQAACWHNTLAALPRLRHLLQP